MFLLHNFLQNLSALLDIQKRGSTIKIPLLRSVPYAPFTYYIYSYCFLSCPKFSSYMTIRVGIVFDFCGVGIHYHSIYKNEETSKLENCTRDAPKSSRRVAEQNEFFLEIMFALSEFLTHVYIVGLSMYQTASETRNSAF